MPTSIRVLIADDQVLFAESLQYVLKGVSSLVEVVGIACNGQEAVEQAVLLKPDLILMDIRMPVMDGVEATRRVRELVPNAKIVILTTFDDDEYVHYALKYGAVGYLLKNIRPDELIVSMRAVMAGASLFASGITNRIVADGDPTVEEKTRIVASLSRRERQVLGLVMEMKNNQQISDDLHISEHSVRNYVSNLYTAFGTRDRMMLIQQLRDHWSRLHL